MAFYGPNNQLILDSSGIVSIMLDSDGYSTSNSATWQSTMIKVENPNPGTIPGNAQFGDDKGFDIGFGKILVRNLPEGGAMSRISVYDYDGNFVDSIGLPTNTGWHPSYEAFTDNWGALVAVGNGRIAIAADGYRQDKAGQSDPTKITTNIALYDMDLNYIKSLYPSQHNNSVLSGLNTPSGLDPVKNAGGAYHRLKISNGKVIFGSEYYPDSQGVSLGDSEAGRITIFDLYDWDSGEEIDIYPKNIMKDDITSPGGGPYSYQGFSGFDVKHNRIFVGGRWDSDGTNSIGSFAIYDLHSGKFIRRIENPSNVNRSNSRFGSYIGAGSGRLCVTSSVSRQAAYIYDLNGELIKDSFNPGLDWTSSPYLYNPIIENEKIYLPIENRSGIKREHRVYVLDLYGNTLGFIHEDDSDFSYKFDDFGTFGSMRADGNMLVVGNVDDSSSATGVSRSGSIYIFTIGDETYSNYVDNVMDLKR